MATPVPLHPEWLPESQVPGAAYTVFPVHSVYLCPGVKFIAAILKILLLEIKYLSL